VKDAADYLARVKALMLVNSQVMGWKTVREEAQGNAGLFRYRLELRDGGMMEAFERFQVEAGTARVTKYSFHWQDADDRLRKRWDNARHHPELRTFPNHVHDGSEDNVLPHEPVSIEEVLTMIAAEGA